MDHDLHLALAHANLTITLNREFEERFITPNIGLVARDDARRELLVAPVPRLNNRMAFTELGWNTAEGMRSSCPTTMMGLFLHSVASKRIRRGMGSTLLLVS